MTNRVDLPRQIPNVFGNLDGHIDRIIPLHRHDGLVQGITR